MTCKHGETSCVCSLCDYEAMEKHLADLPMSKAEAIKAMEAGKKVTHMHFVKDEWIAIKDGKFIFEDGCTCSFKHFWQDRIDASWLEGWKLYLKDS